MTKKKKREKQKGRERVSIKVAKKKYWISYMEEEEKDVWFKDDQC